MWNLFCSCPMCGHLMLWCHIKVQTEFSTLKWSYDKMFIDLVMSGRIGKYLPLSKDTTWPRAKYFPIQPSHSVNNYIICSNQSSFYVTLGILITKVRYPKVQPKLSVKISYLKINKLSEMLLLTVHSQLDFSPKTNNGF